MSSLWTLCTVMAAMAAPLPDVQRGEVLGFWDDVHIDVNHTADHVVAVGGTIVVDGHISGDVVALGGHIQLNSSARVDGHAIALGGRVLPEPHAQMTSSAALHLYRSEVEDSQSGELAVLPLHGAILDRLRWWLTTGVAIFGAGLWVWGSPHREGHLDAAPRRASPRTTLLGGVGLLSVTGATAASLLLARSLPDGAAAPVLVFAAVLLTAVLALSCVGLGITSRDVGRWALPDQSPRPAQILAGAVGLVVLFSLPIVGVFAWVLTSAHGVGRGIAAYRSHQAS